MSEILKGLNAQQHEAATYTEGPLEILAGAGSGKTTVMMRRTAYLIEEKNVLPNRILGVTFTKKAANEMKERIVSLIGEKGRYVKFYTFHSFCTREILRNDLFRLGFTDKFTIYDDVDSKKIIEGILKQLGYDTKEVKPSVIYSYISSLKNEFVDPQSYELEKPMNRLMDWDKVLFLMEGMPFFYRQIVTRVYSAYQTQLRESNAVDFDDIINYSVELFEKFPEVKTKYQQYFDYIIVDEYQDTNRAQYWLIRFLAEKHQNIAVVGDDFQGIYGFRGADIRNILEFERDYPNCKVIKLEQNYRSTQTILNVANDVIKKNVNQKPKTLFTDKTGGKLVKYDTYMTERDEAQAVCKYIKDEVRSGRRSYKDFTILVRVNADTRPFEDIFVNSNVPYEIIGGTKFYARKEIKDIMAYLRFLVNRKDRESFERLCGAPKRGIGDTTLDKIYAYAKKNDISIWDTVLEAECVLKGKALTKIIELRSLINECDRMISNDSIPTLVTQLYHKSGLYDDCVLEDEKKDSHRCENMEQFINLAWQYVEESDIATLMGFIERVTLNSDVDDLAGDDKTKLMTYHSAKGLEFPVVFMVCFEEDTLPYGKAKAECGGLEEERRLCYVGITRAKEELFLTNCRIRRKFGQTYNPKPSQFLNEFDHKNLSVGRAYPTF